MTTPRPTPTAHFLLLAGAMLLVCCSSSCRMRRSGAAQSPVADTVTVYRDSVRIRDSVVVHDVYRPRKDAAFIVIDKESLTLTLYGFKGEKLFSARCCTGRHPGNKTSRYDGRTPEGVLPVSMIQDSRLWKHDAHDGRGERLGCYGAHFIRLDYPPYHKIGIHGTDEPESTGTRASEGCIRLRNEDVEKLVPYVYPGMPVIITPGAEDLEVNRAAK